VSRLPFLLLFVFGLVATACGTDSHGSCSISSSGTTYCMEFPGSSFGTAASVEHACTSEGGSYSSSGCATADRIGSCTVGAGTADEFVSYFYSTGGTTVAEGQFFCTAMSGTWSS